MQKIIKNGAIAEDSFVRVNASNDHIELPDADVLVDVATLNRFPNEILKHHKAKAVLLSPSEGPDLIAPHLGKLDMVAIDFPQFADGRGYSSAYLLRNRYGFKGELRATGDVIKDTLFYQQRCGFNSFVVREGKDITDALDALKTFSHPYQASTDNPIPLFRSR